MESAAPKPDQFPFKDRNIKKHAADKRCTICLTTASGYGSKLLKFSENFNRESSFF